MEDDGSESFSLSMDDDCIVIADVYDSNEMAYNVLEQALETEAAMIVIEPYQLGDETSRWIRVGNCLHKTTVLTAAGCFLLGQLLPKNSIGCVSLSLGSLLCATIYAISWQFDPCCKYQVETDARKLEQIPFESLSSTSPVVLVRKDDTRRENSSQHSGGCFRDVLCHEVLSLVPAVSSVFLDIYLLDVYNQSLLVDRLKFSERLVYFVKGLLKEL